MIRKALAVVNLAAISHGANDAANVANPTTAIKAILGGNNGSESAMWNVGMTMTKETLALLSAST
jgi:uncharacterized Fe-S radical SAM superfamily protein PflX